MNRFSEFTLKVGHLMINSLSTLFRGLGQRFTSVETPTPTRHLNLIKLEERILMSSSPIPPELVEGAGDDGTPELAELDDLFAQLASAESNITSLDNAFDDVVSTLVAPDDTQAETQKQSVLFIDETVLNVDQLIDSIQSSSSEILEVVLIDSNRDGIEQITEALSRFEDLDSIHIVSHGSDGSVQLGNNSLNNQTLSRYGSQLSAWGDSLRSGSDILFYGCDLAGSTAGESLVESISHLTGSDVAASDDLTGHTDLGGDWDLEFSTGVVETTIPFGQTIQADWYGVLATIVVTQNSDVVNGDIDNISDIQTDDGGDGISLREAILAIEGEGGSHEITLGAGEYHLAITGSGDDKGDFDIDADITIRGDHALTTIIDADDIDRIFEVHGNLNLEDVTLRDGDTSNGGAIRIRSDGSATLSRVILRSNEGSGKGGGIYNEGTIFLTDVEFRDNTEDSGTLEGGGLYNSGTATLHRVTFSNNDGDLGGAIYNTSSDLELHNVTITGNTADEAGGIWTDESITITNSTIASNTARDGAGSGGGIYAQGSNGDASLAYTILSNNSGGSSNTSLTSLGNNIDSDGPGTFTIIQITDTVGTAPSLGVLQDNGGFVRTMALPSGSAAIDPTNIGGAESLDARGYSRDSTPDIGAAEYVPDSVISSAPTADVDIIETSHTNRGSAQSVAMDSAGNYVIVWSHNDGTSWDVYAQQFFSNGTANGTAFLVHPASGSDEQWASVDVADDGRFVVTWTSDAGGDEDVYVATYAADGNQIMGPTQVFSDLSDERNSSVSIDSFGNFIVAAERDAGTNEIMIDRYDFLGNQLLVGETVIKSSGGTLENATVALNDSGEFVVVWDNFGDVHFDRFSTLTGAAPIDNDQKVDSHPQARNATVDINQNGAFVIAYTVQGISGDAVYSRAYDNTGTAIQLPRVVNETFTGHQSDPSLSLDDDGNFIVTWEGNGVGDSSGIFMRKFNASGVAVTSETLVNQHTSQAQDQAGIAALDLDNFVVVWSGRGEGGEDGVFARNYYAATPNIAPAVSNSSMGTVEDTDMSFSAADFTGFFWDGDGDVLSHIRITALPGNGTLLLSDVAIANNSIISVAQLANLEYSPSDDYHGTDFVSWTASDGIAWSSSSAQITITVSPVNDRPVILDIDKSGTEDQTLTFTLAEFQTAYSDVEGSALSHIRITTLPLNGTLKLAGIDVVDNQVIAAANISTLTFEPADDFNGDTSFRWKAKDGSRFSTRADVNITLTPENDAPTLRNVVKSGTEDTTINFSQSDFTSAFSDIDGDSLTAVRVDALPTSGILKLSGKAVLAGQVIDVGKLSNLTFEPTKDFDGVVNLTWNGTDGVAFAANPASVTITVNGDNDAPVASHIAKTLDEDTTLSFEQSDFINAYSDADGDLISSIRIVTAPSNGVLTLDGNKISLGQAIKIKDVTKLQYTPDENYDEVETFLYQASDGTDWSNTRKIAVRINPINDVPEALSILKSGTEDETVQFSQSDFLDNYSDVENDALTHVQLIRLPVSGSVELNGVIVNTGDVIAVADLDNLTYEPEADQNGLVSFKWHAYDGSDWSDTAAPVRINIDSINDPGMLQLTNTVTTVVENQAELGSIKVADINIIDDGEGTNVVTLVGQDAHLFEIVGSELFIRDKADLDHETNGQLQVAVILNDIETPVRPDDIEILHIDVQDINEAPTAQTDRFTTLQQETITLVLSGLTDNDIDPEGDALSVTLIGAAKHGAIIVNGDGTIEYIAPENFIGNDSFTYRVSDGTSTSEGTVVITINPALPPVVEDLEPEPEPEEEEQNEEEPIEMDGSAETDDDDDGIIGVPQPKAATPASILDISPQVTTAQIIASSTDTEMSFQTDRVSGLIEITTRMDLPPVASVATWSITPLEGTDLASSPLTHDVTAMREALTESALFKGFVVDISMTAATGLSVGYVIWALRASILVSSLMSSLPAWRMLDPIPILAAASQEDGDDQESLQSLVV